VLHEGGKGAGTSTSVGNAGELKGDGQRDAGGWALQQDQGCQGLIVYAFRGHAAL